MGKIKLAYSYPGSAYGHDLLKVGRSVTGFLLYPQASFPKLSLTVCSCQQCDVCSVFIHSVFHLFLSFYEHGRVVTLNTSNFKNLLQAVYFLLLANLVGEDIMFPLFRLPVGASLSICVNVLVTSCFCDF